MEDDEDYPIDGLYDDDDYDELEDDEIMDDEGIFDDALEEDGNFMQSELDSIHDKVHNYGG